MTIITSNQLKCKTMTDHTIMSVASLIKTGNYSTLDLQKSILKKYLEDTILSCIFEILFLEYLILYL